MTELAYPFTVRPLMPEEGGGWLVEFPDLPGCMADGETPEEAMREAGDALHSWLETARTHGDPIPPPSSPDVAGYSGKWVLRTPRSLLLARAGASLLERLSRHLPIDAQVDRISAEMAQCFWYVDDTKARSELGFSPRDPGETLADTVADLRARGVVWPKEQAAQGAA